MGDPNAAPNFGLGPAMQHYHQPPPPVATVRADSQPAPSMPRQEQTYVPAVEPEPEAQAPHIEDAQPLPPLTRDQMETTTKRNRVLVLKRANIPLGIEPFQGHERHPCPDWNMQCLGRCDFRFYPKRICSVFAREGFCYAYPQCTNDHHIVLCENGFFYDFPAEACLTQGAAAKFAADPNSVEALAFRKQKWTAANNLRKQRAKQNGDEAIREAVRIRALEGDPDALLQAHRDLPASRTQKPLVNQRLLEMNRKRTRNG
jgi:hypothetical protein